MLSFDSEQEINNECSVYRVESVTVQFSTSTSHCFVLIVLQATVARVATKEVCVID